MDSIVPTPFFAISQSDNAGLQMADFVTTIIGLRFSSHPDISPFYDNLKHCFFRFKTDEGAWHNSLKVVRDKKAEAPGGS